MALVTICSGQSNVHHLFLGRSMGRIWSPQEGFSSIVNGVSNQRLQKNTLLSLGMPWQYSHGQKYWQWQMCFAKFATSASENNCSHSYAGILDLFLFSCPQHFIHFKGFYWQQKCNTCKVPSFKAIKSALIIKSYNDFTRLCTRSLVQIIEMLAVHFVPDPKNCEMWVFVWATHSNTRNITTTQNVLCCLIK